MNTIGKNAKISNAITGLLLLLTTAQAYITAPPLTPEQVNLLSPIVLFSVLLFGQIKNILAPDVNKKAKWPIIIVAAIAIAGGLNDYLFKIVHFTAQVEQYLRLALTVISATLTLYSKRFFPTEISLTEKKYVA